MMPNICKNNLADIKMFELKHLVNLDQNNHPSYTSGNSNINGVINTVIDTAIKQGTFQFDCLKYITTGSNRWFGYQNTDIDIIIHATGDLSNISLQLALKSLCKSNSGSGSGHGSNTKSYKIEYDGYVYDFIFCRDTDAFLEWFYATKRIDKIIDDEHEIYLRLRSNKYGIHNRIDYFEKARKEFLSHINYNTNKYINVVKYLKKMKVS